MWLQVEVVDGESGVDMRGEWGGGDAAGGPLLLRLLRLGQLQRPAQGGAGGTEEDAAQREGKRTAQTPLRG